MELLPLTDLITFMRTVLMLLIFLPAVAYGQRSFASLGADLGVPNNQLKSSAKTGFGFSLRYEHPLNKKIAVMGTLGNLWFGKKSYTQKTNPPTILTSKVNMLLMQAGVKYYLSSTSKDQKGLYVFGELGIHIVTVFITLNRNQGSGQEGNFSYAPGVGYRIRNLELSYRQQFLRSHGSSVNYSGFKLAYVLKAKEEPKLAPY
jgi:hypothetical protein